MQERSAAPADARIIAPTTVAVAGPTGPGFEAGNKAVQFTTGGFVQAPALNLNTNSVTITCWVKPSGDQAEHAGIIFHRARLATGASGTTAGLKMDAVAGLNLSYNWDGDMATYNWNSEMALTDGEWNFVALIVHPDKAILFVPSNPNYLPVTRQGYDISHAPLEFEGGTYIGMDPMTDNTTTTRKFVGSVDEVAIFNRALSIGETYTQYAAAVGSLPPKIFANPVAPVDPVYAGDSLTLTVDAGGTPDLTYTWRKNGTPIPGATSSSFTIPSLAASDTGDYTVTVSNSHGQAASGAASLYVLDQTQPSFVQDLPVASRTLYPGGSIKLSVVAAGGGLTYTWKKNGNPIQDATGPALVVSNITADDAGTYLVTVSNSAGSTDSASMTITVAAPAAGSYEAEVAADAPRAWYRLDDPADAALMLDATGRFDGYYTNRLGTPVTLGVPGALANDDNTAATFLHTDQAWGEAYPPAVTMGDYTFECWVRTDDTTTFLSPLSSFRTQYGVVLWKDAATWRSGDGYGDLDVGVTVRSSAVGGAQPGKWMHFVVTLLDSRGHTALMSTACGTAMRYIDHSRNRNAPLRIGAYDPVTGGENEFWTGEIDEVAVYNTALSEARILAHYQAALYPNTKPFFLREPVTQAVLPSTSVTFEAQADGSFPIAYQWFKNGTAIEGATSASYPVTASGTPSGPDEYYVRASNGVGETLSRVATLTVLRPRANLLECHQGPGAPHEVRRRHQGLLWPQQQRHLCGRPDHGGRSPWSGPALQHRYGHIDLQLRHARCARRPAVRRRCRLLRSLLGAHACGRAPRRSAVPVQRNQFLRQSRPRVRPVLRDRRLVVQLEWHRPGVWGRRKHQHRQLASPGSCRQPQRQCGHLPRRRRGRFPLRVDAGQCRHDQRGLQHRPGSLGRLRRDRGGGHRRPRHLAAHAHCLRRLRHPLRRTESRRLLRFDHRGHARDRDGRNRAQDLVGRRRYHGTGRQRARTLDHRPGSVLTLHGRAYRNRQVLPRQELARHPPSFELRTAAPIRSGPPFCSDRGVCTIPYKDPSPQPSPIRWEMVPLPAGRQEEGA